MRTTRPLRPSSVPSASAAAARAPLASAARLAARFPPHIRPQVRELLELSPRLADLAQSFPGLVATLAWMAPSCPRRAKGIELAIAGAPLRDLMRVLDVPAWLRTLPPQAFAMPLPALPADEAFARRIANRRPRGVRVSATWLAAVAFGYQACHRDFALWLAGFVLPMAPDDVEELIAVLAAYAWHSGADAGPARRYVVTPWHPDMAFDTALCAAKSWLNRLRLVLQIGDGALSDPWLAGGVSGGFTFAPLLTQHELLAEAAAMGNCADQYADRLARDRCRLFAIREAGVAVAMVEVATHPREAGFLTISQLKGRHNLPATLEVWQAAHAWLARQDGLRRMAHLVPPERAFDAGRWEALMGRYRATHGGAPWLPSAANATTFAALDADLADLARRTGVTSWLFT